MAFGWDDAAMIGAQLVGGLFGGGPDQQERQSFKGQKVSGVSVDPRNMLAQSKVLNEDVLMGLLDQLSQPVEMKTTVQPLPSYVGGGLPMAISAPGKDQALADPGRLTTPGLNIPRRALDPRINQAPGGDRTLFGRNISESIRNATGAPAPQDLAAEIGGRTPAPVAPRTAVPREGQGDGQSIWKRITQRRNRIPPTQPTAQAGSDPYGQALAALQLLQVQ